jgi:hypothetical protein
MVSKIIMHIFFKSSKKSLKASKTRKVLLNFTQKHKKWWDELDILQPYVIN